VQNGRALPPPIGKTNGAPSAAAAAAAVPSSPASAPRLTGPEVIKVAARASVDPKTVRRYLRGEACHSTTAHRIAQGLVKCGLPEFVRAHSR
jgi:hypothetical protein